MQRVHSGFFSQSCQPGPVLVRDVHAVHVHVRSDPNKVFEPNVETLYYDLTFQFLEIKR